MIVKVSPLDIVAATRLFDPRHTWAVPRLVPSDLRRFQKEREGRSVAENRTDVLRQLHKTSLTVQLQDLPLQASFPTRAPLQRPVVVSIGCVAGRRAAPFIQVPLTHQTLNGHVDGSGVGTAQAIIGSVGKRIGSCKTGGGGVDQGGSQVLPNLDFGQTQNPISSVVQTVELNPDPVALQVVGQSDGE